MTEDQILGDLTGLFRALFLRDDIVLEPATTAADVEGWDSLRHIEVMLAVEDHFGLRFSSGELDAMHCVGDLVRTIALRT